MTNLNRHLRGTPDGTHYFDTDIRIADNQWHNLMVVRSGSSVMFYVDGTGVGSFSTGTGPTKLVGLT